MSQSVQSYFAQWRTNFLFFCLDTKEPKNQGWASRRPTSDSRPEQNKTRYRSNIVLFFVRRATVEYPAYEANAEKIQQQKWVQTCHIHAKHTVMTILLALLREIAFGLVPFKRSR